ncbi:MAG: hypothetical protein SF123_17935 [Chloroflexota bacterium]|nr:hypothetical protein [Chloroflexota bacterium]
MPSNGHKKLEALKDDAAQELREFGREVRHKANDAKKDVVSKLYDAAEGIRREVRESKASKDARHSADSVARQLEKAAHYINRHSFEDMGEDVEKIVRRPPVRIVLIALVVGLVIGLIMRNSNRKLEVRGDVEIKP